VLPIEGGQWFVFSGGNDGWRSPQHFIETLQKGEFMDSGAAVGESAPYVICMAALNTLEKRKARAEGQASQAEAAAAPNVAEAAPDSATIH
jgi:hypothetical protein